MSPGHFSGPSSDPRTLGSTSRETLGSRLGFQGVYFVADIEFLLVNFGATSAFVVMIVGYVFSKIPESESECSGLQNQVCGITGVATTDLSHIVMIL